MTGDLVKLESLGNLDVGGGSLPLIMYYHVRSFFKKDSEYWALGDIFMHSSFQGLGQHLYQLQNQDCYVGVRILRSQTRKLVDLKYARTLKSN